jgi:hypothetical protein
VNKHERLIISDLKKLGFIFFKSACKAALYIILSQKNAALQVLKSVKIDKMKA